MEDDVTESVSMSEQEMRSAIYSALVCFIRDRAPEPLRMSVKELEKASRGTAIHIQVAGDEVTFALSDSNTSIQ